MKRFLIAAIALVCLIPSVSMAINIDYTLSSLGGSSYQYDYTVINDGSLGAGVNVSLFDIDFDPALYNEATLTVTSTAEVNNDYAQQFLASAPGVPADYDVYALADGVSGSTSGFAVQFNWLGGGSGPGNQPFSISDPNTFVTLEEGFTSLNGTTPVDPPTAPVPEPGTILFTCIGLISLYMIRKRQA